MRVQLRPITDPIGQEESWQIEYFPGHFERIHHVRKKYACAACESNGDNPRIDNSPLGASRIFIKLRAQHIQAYNGNTRHMARNPSIFPGSRQAGGHCHSAGEIFMSQVLWITALRAEVFEPAVRGRQPAWRFKTFIFTAQFFKERNLPEQLLLVIAKSAQSIDTSELGQ